MASGAFHIIYTSAQYDATIAFYRDGLELPVIGGWDEGPQRPKPPMVMTGRLRIRNRIE